MENLSESPCSGHQVVHLMPNQFCYADRVDDYFRNHWSVSPGYAAGQQGGEKVVAISHIFVIINLMDKSELTNLRNVSKQLIYRLRLYKETYDRCLELNGQLLKSDGWNPDMQTSLDSHLTSLRFLIDFLIKNKPKDMNAVDYFKGSNSDLIELFTNDKSLGDLFNRISSQRAHPSKQGGDFKIISDQKYPLESIAKKIVRYYQIFFDNVPDEYLESGVKNKAYRILNDFTFPGRNDEIASTT